MTKEFKGKHFKFLCIICFALCFFAFMLTEVFINERCVEILESSAVNVIYTLGLVFTGFGFLSFPIFCKLCKAEKLRKIVVFNVSFLCFLSSIVLLITENIISYSKHSQKGQKTAITLIVSVLLMSFVVGIIDSVLTSFNAEREYAIYSGVRLFYALGLILAGFVADMQKRDYLPLATVCALLLSSLVGVQFFQNKISNRMPQICFNVALVSLIISAFLGIPETPTFKDMAILDQEKIDEYYEKNRIPDANVISEIEELIDEGKYDEAKTLVNKLQVLFFLFI